MRTENRLPRLVAKGLQDLPALALNKVMRSDPEVAALLGQTCSTYRREARYLAARDDSSPFEHLALERPYALGSMRARMTVAEKLHFCFSTHKPRSYECTSACLAQALGHGSQQLKFVSSFCAPCAGIYIGINHVWTEAKETELVAMESLIETNRATELAWFLRQHPSVANEELPGSGLSPLNAALSFVDHSSALVVEVLRAYGAEIFQAADFDNDFRRSYELQASRVPWTGYDLGKLATTRAIRCANWWALHSLVRSCDRVPWVVSDSIVERLLADQRVETSFSQRARWVILQTHMKQAPSPWVQLALMVVAECVAITGTLDALCAEPDATQQELYAAWGRDYLGRWLEHPRYRITVPQLRTKFSTVPSLLFRRLGMYDARVDLAVNAMLKAVDASREEYFREGFH